MNLISDEKYEELKTDAQKLIQYFEQIQGSERTLSMKDILFSIQKIIKLTDGNLKESLFILDGLVHEKAGSVDAAEILELKNIQSTIKEQQEEQQINYDRFSDLKKRYQGEVSDFEPLGWSVEKFKELLPIIGSNHKNLSTWKESWNNISGEINKEKQKIVELCAKCRALALKFKDIKDSKSIKLILTIFQARWTNGKTHYIEKAITERREHLKELDKNGQSLKIELEQSIQNIKVINFFKTCNSQFQETRKRHN